jgi:hypothetical protein
MSESKLKQEPVLQASVGFHRFWGGWVCVLAGVVVVTTLVFNTLFELATLKFYSLRGGAAFALFVFLAWIVWFPVLGCCCTSCNNLFCAWFPEHLDRVGLGHFPVPFVMRAKHDGEGLEVKRGRSSTFHLDMHDAVVVEVSEPYIWHYHSGGSKGGGYHHRMAWSGLMSGVDVKTTYRRLSTFDDVGSIEELSGFKGAPIVHCFLPGSRVEGFRRWLRLGLVKTGCRVEQAGAKDFAWLSRETFRCSEIRELFKLRDRISPSPCKTQTMTHQQHVTAAIENALSSLSISSSGGAATSLDDIEIIEQKDAGTMQIGGIFSAHATESREGPDVQSSWTFAQDDTSGDVSSAHGTENREGRAVQSRWSFAHDDSAL